VERRRQRQMCIRDRSYFERKQKTTKAAKAHLKL
jgi:hypothetical protein